MAEDSAVMFWLVLVGFLLSAVDVLGFVALQGLVAGFAAFVPRLLVAMGILVVGYVAASWLILILAGAMALDRIALAQTIVLMAFAIAFGALMLGLAIAFGNGGGGIARRILDQFPERERSCADEMSHL